MRRLLLSQPTGEHCWRRDEDGYPCITPLWFLWEVGVFYMTSVEGRRHLRN